jgi:hypothetical protein
MGGRGPWKVAHDPDSRGDGNALAVFKIASVTPPPAVLTWTVGDLPLNQAQDHPAYIPRTRALKVRG